MKTFCILVRGIPGSGKSTFGMSLAEYLGVPKVEADDYFLTTEGEYNFDSNELKIAHEECQRRAVQAAKKFSGVVVCNTFSTIPEMQFYLDNFDQILVMKKPLRCYQNTHQVPAHVIAKMIDRWEPFEGELTV